jgi:hypothetical protein
MIYEFFSFYNEHDMLELKLQEHAQHVDRFVITESNRTYNQIDKPYRLEQQWDRYQQWHDKIHYLKFNADGLETGWPTEQAQREHGPCSVALEPQDIMVISDLDEFLRDEDWLWLEQNISNYKREILFEMECYWCFADVQHARRQQALAVTQRHKYINSTLHRRPMKTFADQPNPLSDTTVQLGGVHLTWMGDEQRFREKLLGSIEGHSWTRGKDANEMWRQKQRNQLFNWKPKFKTKNTKIVDIQKNNSFSASMREYMLKHPEWLFNK